MTWLRKEYKKMKYVTLKGTDIKVSNPALGTDSMGEPMTEEVSREVLDSFTEAGGTLIDTALSYNDWAPGEKSRSEKIIGRWLKDRGNRHNLVISTKGGHPPMGNMDISRLSEKEIFSDINESLTHLGTDYVDIYFLHRDDERLPVAPIMETLNKLVKSGKTRSIGLSNWHPCRVKEAMDYCNAHNLAPITSSQIQFGGARPNIHLIDPTISIMDKQGYEFYKNENINVFAFSAQSKGYFSKLDAGSPLSPKASERYDNPQSRIIFEKLKELSAKYGCTVTEAVSAVLCSNPAFVTIPILGCKKPEHVKTSIRASDIQISPADVAKVLKLGLIVHN